MANSSQLRRLFLLMLGIAGYLAGNAQTTPVTFDNFMRVKLFQTYSGSEGWGEYLQNLKNYNSSWSDGIGLFTNEKLRLGIDNTKTTFYTPINLLGPGFRLTAKMPEGTLNLSSVNAMSYTIEPLNYGSAVVGLAELPGGTPGNNVPPSNPGAFGFNWLNGTSELMRLTQDGRLGIGTQNPRGGLEVVGTDMFFRPASWNTAGHQVKLNLGDANHQIIGEYGKGLIFKDYNGFMWRNNTAFLMKLTSDGKLGIGTENPRGGLEVVGTDMFFRPLSWNTNGHQVKINLGDANHQIIGEYGRGLVFKDVNGFTWRGNEGYIMKLTADGKLGIGTQNPAEALQVNGKVKANAIDVEEIYVKGNLVDLTDIRTSPLDPNRNPWEVYGNSIVSRSYVGIGDYITSPKTMLHVAGNAITVELGDNTGYAQLYGTKLVWKPGSLLQNFSFGTSRDYSAEHYKELVSISDDGKVIMYGMDGKTAAFKLRGDVFDKYTLMVNGGTLSTDYAMAPVDSWADFVFKNDYQLPKLDEVEAFILKNKHLPNIPSELEVSKNGYSLHDLNVRLLEKIEQLTLYAIEQQKHSDAQQREMDQLREQLNKYEQLAKEVEGIKALLKKD